METSVFVLSLPLCPPPPPLKKNPQWGAADAEIKVPSDENTELKRSLFKAWSRSVYSHTCYAYFRGFLPCLFLVYTSIHLHFFQNFSRFSLCWLWLTHGSCVGPQNKIGHPAGCRFPCPRNINRLKKKHDFVVWWLVKWLTWKDKFVFSPDVILCGWLDWKHQLTN